ncbi:hypothetical protein FGIG_05086 [Fasciola gigantica]|uniref:Reverse transcriptase domain-containing protein n=1 Tax=Fasciola gigantica TaxID=46835 RepID=A0A504YL72_FASGI|nr:hypothetical protein FGIG_05086 [Fasciola gigantica]
MPLTWYFNLPPRYGCPATLPAARVTLIPRVPDATPPAQYRPLAGKSIILRCLHKILALCWAGKLKLSSLKLVFMQRNGRLEATAILQGIFRGVHARCRPISKAFLDVSNAFDMVLHDAISREATNHGTPLLLLEYKNPRWGLRPYLIGYFDFVVAKKPPNEANNIRTSGGPGFGEHLLN